MKRNLLISLFFSLLLIACGGSAEPEFATDYSTQTAPSPVEYDESAIEESVTDELAKTASTEEPIQSTNTQSPEKEEPQGNKFERKLIKIGSVTFKVENFDKARIEIEKEAKKWGGYISNENAGTTSYQISGEITIRVPAQNFDSLMIGVSGAAQRIDSKQVQVLDVSEDFYDTKTRLETKRKVEERYLQILNQARSIDDILSVESYLRVIREEIEAKEGHLRYLEDQVGFSTLTISYYQVLDYTYVPDDKPNFWQRLIQAFDWGWTGFLEFLIAFFTLWPLWLITAGIIVLIVRRVRKRRAAKAAANNVTA